MEMPDARWLLYLSNLAELGVAFLLALPIAWNWESETRSVGLRTFPLVAIASCGFMLIGQDVVGDKPDALARLMYGLMTGIGFIGGGAILKEGGNVSGTATAASIWNTGAIGTAVAFHRYEIAVALSLANFFILRLMPAVKGRV